MPSANPPRRFAPQPVEQSTKSSRQRSPPKPDNSSESAGPRRFAPIPTETSVKSSRDDQPQEAPTPRRFVPQIVEESRKSSADGKGATNGSGAPHIRFKPEPISTTRRSNRSAEARTDEPVSPGAVSQAAETKTPRKFAPVLLDTARRSRRASGDGAAARQIEKTEESAFTLHAREHRRHITGKKTPAPGSVAGMDDGDDAMDVQPADAASMSDAVLPPRRTSVSARQHSFRMPDLDTIESSESDRDDSGPSSRSSSPRHEGSPFTASDSSHEYYKHATRKRESFDESFTQYLLELERKKAQQRLEEQALAAYPNADFGYEPPHHYVNTEDDESDGMEIEDRPVTFEPHEEDYMDISRRRQSTASMSWEQSELQRHAEAAQQERTALQLTARRESSHSPWWRPQAFADFQEKADREISSMRDRARPPMLGHDLVFPRCPSPEPTRFDATQRPGSQPSVHLSGDRSDAGGDEGLWKASVPQALSRVTSAQSATSGASNASDKKGLWGGFCVTDASAGAAGGLFPPVAPTGLLTPNVERSNPMDDAFLTSSRPGAETGGTSGIAFLTTPADPGFGRIDSVLSSERSLDETFEQEYPDAFITQVFNYLSLGYPSLARPFDAELAKISGIAVSELRRDDATAAAQPRGYIRLGADFEGGGGEAGGGETECVRWRALRLYIREWARQEKNMVAPAAGADVLWPAGARRGSWAI